MGRRPAARDDTADTAEPDTSEAAVAAWYEAGVALIRTARYFEAHEELELAWRAAAAEERDFFQGLVHVTVAWYQARRGNTVGCRRQLEKAARRLAPYAPEHRGLALEPLLRHVEVARDTVAAGSLELPPPPLRPGR